MGALQPIHLIVVLIIVLIIFGPGKLPQLGKAVGDGIRELKRATNDEPVAKAVSPEMPAGTPVAAAAQAIWNCPQCHAPAPATDRFCGSCGAARDGSNRAAGSSAAL
jgi:sec-independent protein translocase protein TatA